MTRSCARPDCSQAASATLSYDYNGREAWLDELIDTPDPMLHDLCTRHADSLSVPRGWRLEDRRPASALFRDALAS